MASPIIRDDSLVTATEIQERINSLQRQYDTLNSRETGRNGYFRAGDMDKKMAKLRKLLQRKDILTVRLHILNRSK